MKELNNIIKYFFFTILSFLFLVVNQVVGQINESPINVNKERDLRIMFYNCENLFDTFDDSVKRDNEFLPKGDKNWSYYRYRTKLNHIYKVIIAIGGWNPPDIVGLCEVENQLVVDELNSYTPLSRVGYKVIHYESPDKRGIDVAMLYQPKSFTVLNSYPIPIHFPGQPEHKTRDILYVKGKVKNNDTLHVFINHWPSKWSGALESEPSRMYVASVLRKHVDSIFKTDSLSEIIMMGDLNDEPEDKSLTVSLGALESYDNVKPNEVYNISYYLKHTKKQGSHKYQSEWGILDQIIVSGSLLNPESGIYTTLDAANVFNGAFLLEKDKTYLGNKPFRTYSGFTYNDGFSDHLPVFIDLYFNKN
ncbi:MAG: endonuclease [Chlorobi bacterium]|nr:endonuclease [Chlorobiota bacterium]